MNVPPGSTDVGVDVEAKSRVAFAAWLPSDVVAQQFSAMFTYPGGVAPAGCATAVSEATTAPPTTPRSRATANRPVKARRKMLTTPNVLFEPPAVFPL